jgi:hypothetical protein
MVNEDIANKVINIQINTTKSIGREILKQISKLRKKSKKYGSLEKLAEAEGKEVKLKDLIKKGQLEEISIEKTDLKELKKELNKYGVKFSVMKDKVTGQYSVFFQAKDMKVMDKAFRNALATLEKKAERKESIRKNIEKFKEMMKNTVYKDKVKNKQKEQSL